MPRRKSEIPSATRHRDNQRRSRARRKELIVDLQQRLQQYECKEVQATILMQLAARRVAQENVRLRELLVHKGLSKQEVDDFVAGGPWLDCRPSLQHAVDHLSGNSPITEPQSLQTSLGGEPLSPIQKDRRQDGTSPRDNGLAENHLSSTESHFVREQMNSAYPQLSPVNSLTSEPTPSLSCPKVQELAQNSHKSGLESERCRHSSTIFDCFCPANSSIVPSQSDNVMLEMSCETAAGIIAGMRGHGDIALARSKLGCEAGTHCNVKNVDVLQVMEFDG